MKKIAIVSDTNNLSHKEGAELGVSLISMPFVIDNREYKDGIDLSREEFFAFMNEDADITTSQPSINEIGSTWTELLKTYDEIIHVPMSSGLSGSCETAMLLSTYEEFEGKVFVIDNKRISVQQIHAINDAHKLIEAGKSGAEIKEYLEEHASESSVYIMVDTLKYLKKGGRVTPTAAAIGTLLRIKPVLQIQGDKLDAYSKARSSKLGVNIMLDALRYDLENKFAGVPREQLRLDFAHTTDQETVEKMLDRLNEEFPEFTERIVCELPLSIATHIGDGAVGFAFTRVL